MRHRHLTSRICLVTADITGPIRNGGIGSAYYSLARLLAETGHDVTVLYALGRHSEQQSIAHWVREYAKQGIALVPLPDAGGPELKGSAHVRTAWAVYDWLKTRTFDVVHFHEWRGIGFYALAAKRQGLCLRNAVTVVGVHSPSLWHLEGMNELPRRVDDVEVDFLERESVAKADVLWSPSAHMLAWMKGHGWRLPREQFVRQYVIREREPRANGGPLAIEEFCFFGRLETRKGLDLFCAALDVLVRRGVAPRQVTFLGKVASVDGVDSAEYIARRSAKWPMPWQIISTLDRAGAMSYLRGEGRLGVLPSRLDNLPYTVLECLGSGVPFVASTVGGIPELLHRTDRDATLFDLRPDALAGCLTRALRDGISPARFRISPETTDRGWIECHEALTRRARRQPVAGPRRRPLVSVCITHRDRPKLLRQALESIDRQTYSRLEVVVVDDGSEGAATIRALQQIETEIGPRGWKMIRQPRRYPGAARNTAARHARGEYLLFMDDDNYAKPLEVETFVKAALTSGAEITTCFLDVFQGLAPPEGKAPLHRWSFIGGSLGVGLFRNCFGDANCLIKAEVWHALGGMTEDYGIGCEDWEFFAKAALANRRIDVLPEALVWYRQSSTGVQNTTSVQANRLRALRPYMAVTPRDLRSALPLCGEYTALMPPETRAIGTDHVRHVVVFGAGEAGRLAIGLARRCGWDVRYIVDNNQALWNEQVHGHEVRSPAALADRDFDLVIVASLAGRHQLCLQLDDLGLSYPDNYAFFLDSFRVDRVNVQLTQ